MDDAEEVEDAEEEGEEADVGEVDATVDCATAAAGTAAASGVDDVDVLVLLCLFKECLTIDANDTEDEGDDMAGDAEPDGGAGAALALRAPCCMDDG